MIPIRIVKGLDVPIAGPPEQLLTEGNEVSRVAVLGADYVGMRPQMQVELGERVKLGQPLFADRKHKRILFTAPGAGHIEAINRGAKRAVVSIVVRLDGDEAIAFAFWPQAELAVLRRDQVVDLLLASGLWTALRSRPYGRPADPDTQPSAIFITAMDSNPLAARAKPIVHANRTAFENGLTVISKLTDGKVFVCQAPRAGLPGGGQDNVLAVEFAGPHPSGLVGTHIHFLHPVGARRTVWHLNYQDTIAIGKLFATGKLWTDRILSLAGPPVRRPRLIRTRLGASINDLVSGELDNAASRVISGSILSGRRAVGPEAYLGRFHNQVSVIADDAAVTEKSHSQPASPSFSAYSALVSGRPPKRRWPLTTSRQGARGPLVPLGGYERVMPLDILPNPLLRALMVGDSDMAQALGCLELEEEDLSLCAFVCPGKINHGALLREMLDHIEKEG